MVFAIAVMAFMAVSLPMGGDDGAEASGALPTISGRVFVDESLDGTLSTGEVGLGDVTVSAYNFAGDLVGTALSATTGAYTLTLDTAHTGTVRVEFSTPTGYQSTLVTAASGGSRSSIRFVDPGATNVDYGVFDPSTACVTLLAHVCFREGPLTSSPDSRVLGISPFSMPTTGNPPKAVGDPGNNQFGQVIPNNVAGLISTAATKVTVGATWGVAVDRSTGLLWNSAVIRRHLSLGSQGVGGVYVVDRNGTLVTSFDLEALGLDLRPSATALGLNAAYETAGKVVFSDANRDILGVTAGDVTSVTGTTYGSRNLPALSRDLPGFSGVGKAGIGDVDISKDSQYLWVTNLNTRTVHRFTIGGTAQAPTLGGLQTWQVDAGHTCAGTTGPLRPWGLEPQADGTILVGAVCTNEGAAPSNSTGPGAGVVLKLNPAGAQVWTELTTVDFGYTHVYDYCTNHATMTCTWKSWTDSFSSIRQLGANNPGPSATGQMWWTQPIIADIATLPDGSLALGINDRFSYMASANNYSPLDVRDPGFITAYTAGGLRLLCKTANGWQQEANGDCAGITTYDSSRTTSFFRNDFQGAHPATSMGGLTYANGVVAYAAMDAASYFTSGVRWVSATNGDQVNALTITGEFGKASGVGDIEAFCDSAPLQIGNRVWYDINADGIQDPDEPPVVGVTVRLYDGAALVGTAVTNASGEYYFTSTNTEAANGGASPDAFGGGLEANTAYTVVMDNADDCAAGEPLDGWDLTLQDSSTSAGPLSRDDLIDSDAAETGASACLYNTATVTVAAMQTGEVDHSYDIGFYVPSVYLGDLVWLDANGNGQLDPEEEGLPGVVLTITKADGTAVTDVLGAALDSVTTSATGFYRFPLLPLGSYKVTVTVPDGYSLVMGYTQVTTSVDLQAYGTGDRLLDFGIVQGAGGGGGGGGGGLAPAIALPPTTGSVSVGDYVWWDTNADGRQDATDVPLEGVVLRITTLEGGPVTDNAGKSVTTTTTNAEGWYTFDNLPLGRYKVTVEAPAGFGSTRAEVGSTDGDSSTGFAVSRDMLIDGDRDPTLDFGFVAVGVSVGNFVWFDANNNGIQDSGEQPIAGAVLSITDMNGNPVRDLAGRLVGSQTTGADGRYLFTNLPPGQYRVTIAYPPGFGPTRPIEGGDRANDSSTFVAVTRVLAAGQADLRLDFGVIPVVSVGDYVWWDTNRDGRQDDTDVPLQGVLLTISTIDGQPVFDSQGRAVTTTSTDTNGWYTFDNLPLGQYIVCVTDPDGFTATSADVGYVDGDSSKGCATSRELPVGGDRDPTLDFGYVALDMRLPSTGTEGRSTGVVALAMLGVGLVALLASSRRRRSEA